MPSRSAVRFTFPSFSASLRLKNSASLWFLNSSKVGAWNGSEGTSADPAAATASPGPSARSSEISARVHVRSLEQVPELAHVAGVVERAQELDRRRLERARRPPGAIADLLQER